MQNDNKTIFVYENWSDIIPKLIGRLYVIRVRGKEQYAFEYDDNFLSQSSGIIIDPEILPVAGRQYPQGNYMFGAFSDSSPDRWGRTLMMRRERIKAHSENRKPNVLMESDFLLGVSDDTRMGALRFRTEDEDEFVTNDAMYPVPPIERLRTLEEASRNYENDEAGLNKEWLDQLIRPGSSLGGARPKATVKDVDDSLWIAKFPSKHDENNTGAWEKTAYDLAELCEINVSDSKVVKFTENGSTFLTKRFDRDLEKRIHFASAMTMLGKHDGQDATDGVSYLEIADFIRKESIIPSFDLQELWKRIAFNAAISNTDDHLRNHGFILTEKGWKLSPAYDINPVPYGDRLSLNIDEYDNLIDVSTVLETSKYYGISKDYGKDLIESIFSTVRDNWEMAAWKNGLTHGQIELMRPAFSICYDYLK